MLQIQHFPVFSKGLGQHEYIYLKVDKRFGNFMAIQL